MLASFPWAYGGIADLAIEGGAAGPRAMSGGAGAAATAISAAILPRRAELHKPEPNLNVLHPKVLIPVLRGRVPKGRSLLACAVLAGLPGDGLEREWASPPVLALDEESGRPRVEWSGRSLVLAAC